MSEERHGQRHLDGSLRTSGNRSEEKQPSRPITTGLEQLQRLIGNRAMAHLLSGSPAVPEDPGSPLRSRDVMHPHLADILARTGPAAGAPVPRAARTPVEQALGVSLAGARIHDDGAARDAARSLGTHAFTVGSHVFLGAGAAASSSEVLTHELAHAGQALQGRVTPHSTAVSTGALEREATAIGRGLHGGARFIGHVAEAGGFGPRARSGLPTLPLGPAVGYPVLRFPGVEPEMLEADKKRFVIDADGTRKPLWTPERGYLRNPAAKPLSKLLQPNGKIGGGFANGECEYIVDTRGEMWLGQRRGQRWPHPSLIGGKDPQVRAAGMVSIEGGRIVSINNKSGHFQPPRESLGEVERIVLKLPTKATSPRLHMGSFVSGAGPEHPLKPFRPLRLRLRNFDLMRIAKKLRWVSIKGKLSSRAFRGRLARAGAGIGALAATLVIQYLLGRWMAEIESDYVRQQIDRLLPKVQAELANALAAHASELDALLEQDPEAAVYVNIRYHLVTFLSPDLDSGGHDESMPAVELVSAGYGREPLPEHEPTKYEHDCLQTIRTETFNVSQPIPIKELLGTLEDEEGDDVVEEQGQGAVRARP